MYQLPHVLLNDLRLKKIPEMLWYVGEYPAVHPNAKFWRLSLKNRKKS